MLNANLHLLKRKLRKPMHEHLATLSLIDLTISLSPCCQCSSNANFNYRSLRLLLAANKYVFIHSFILSAMTDIWFSKRFSVLSHYHVLVNFIILFPRFPRILQNFPETFHSLTKFFISHLQNIHHFSKFFHIYINFFAISS